MLRRILYIRQIKIILFLFISILIFSQNIFSINITKTFGRIISVDQINNLIKAEVYNHSLYFFYKNKYSKVNVYNSKLKIITSLEIIKEQEENGRLFIWGKSQKNTILYTGLYLGFYTSAKKKEPNLPDKVNIKSELPPTFFNSIDRSEMVLIPKGRFVFGSNILGSIHYTSPIRHDLELYRKVTGAKRIHYLQLSDFYIDKYEITNQQFARYLKITGVSKPPHFSFQANALKPVNNVSYIQARNYCQWANKRLPTELEWEKSARGSGLIKMIDENKKVYYQKNSIDYPIGNIFSAEKCNTLESKNYKLIEVNLLKDESPYHTFGMCGNAPEWTSSWLLPYRGNTIKNSLYGRKYKVIKGGSYELNKQFAKSYSRQIGGIPTLEDDYKAGFRCVKDLED